MTIKFTPVGGVEEIGSNFSLIESDNTQVVIDYGIMFPDDEVFGISYLIADHGIIDPEKLRGIVITHAHEDHIGGIFHLLKNFPNTPLYCSLFSKILIELKLDNQKITNPIILFTAQDDLEIGEILVSPFQVTHSIPETHGIYLSDQNREVGLTYISDFKFDLDITTEPPFDLKRLKSLTHTSKKNAFFIDSTNILIEQQTTSEEHVYQSLDSHIKQGPSRVFITLFSSNLFRLQAIFQSAIDDGRKIIILGKSVEKYLYAGLKASLIKDFSSHIVSAKSYKEGSGRYLIILSGCQGDFYSALRRVAYGEDTTFKLNENDLLIFSSKTIPGNETSVFKIYNRLAESGVDFITAKESLTHASGHPGKGDITKLLSHLKPDFYFPIHGESYFLKKHYEFIKEHYPQIKCFLIYNYDEVLIDSEVDIKKLEKVAPVLIHGKRLEVERSVISQRRKLASLGCCFVTIISQEKHFVMSLLGLPEATEQLKPSLEKLLKRVLDEKGKKHNNDDVDEEIRIAIRRFFNQHIGYRPIAIVHRV